MEDVFKYIDYRKLWTMFIENMLLVCKRRWMCPVGIPSIMKWPTFVTTQLLYTKWSYNTTNTDCIFTKWDDLQQFCYFIPNFRKLKTDKVIILDISMFNEKTWSRNEYWRQPKHNIFHIISVKSEIWLFKSWQCSDTEAKSTHTQNTNNSL